MNDYVITKGRWGGEESSFSSTSFMLLFWAARSSHTGRLLQLFVDVTGSPANNAINCILFWAAATSMVNTLFAFHPFLFFCSRVKTSHPWPHKHALPAVVTRFRSYFIENNRKGICNHLLDWPPLHSVVWFHFWVCHQGAVCRDGLTLSLP